MNKPVTLIIILHNRHSNLDRLLHYYKEFTSPIIIADSSAKIHQFREKGHSYIYSYTPGVSFTEKIETVLDKVETPYAVMCADDDFIIPESILKCVEFLENNNDYVSAQGICISYKRSSSDLNRIDFGRMYVNHATDISFNDPMERLEMLFNSYRSLLYSVFRTNVLKLAFHTAGKIVRNLYLNEYLTAIVPILCGKSKELPILYQVREYTEISDDKTTDNLNIIFSQSKYHKELFQFIQLIVENSLTMMNIKKEILSERIYLILEKFSKDPIMSNETRITTKKKIGLIIKNVPILGNWLIEKNRKAEKEIEMKSVIKTEEDKKHLASVKAFLLNYQMSQKES